MKKIKIFCFYIFCFLIIGICNEVNGASVTLSSSSNSATVGDTFSISVNVADMSAASLTTRVSVDTSKIQYVSGTGSSNFSNGRAIYTWTDSTGGNAPVTGGNIVTFTFKALASGTAIFTPSGDFYTKDLLSISPSFSGTTVTIKEPVVEPPPTVEEEPVVTSSDENVISNPTEEISQLEQNNNEVINPEQQPVETEKKLSSNANLKSLQLDVVGISPNFNRNTTRYNLVVSEGINSIRVTAQPEDGNASVSITGNTNLVVGVNTVKILVKAQDGTIKTYIVSVTKSTNPELANAFLENLAIENVILTPEFSTDVVEYKGIVTYNVTTLNILAVPQREGATVEVVGGDNLSFGDNVINVNVLAEDGITVRSYKIVIYRQTEDETLTDVEGRLIDNNIENNMNNEAISPVEKKVKIGDAIYLIIVGISIVGLVGLLLYKYIQEK